MKIQDLIKEAIEMAAISNVESRIDDVTNYYGKTLSSSDDLQSNVCTIEDAFSRNEAAAHARLHPDVLARSYGF